MLLADSQGSSDTHIVPAKYCAAFTGRYGKTIDYYQRTILLFQRISGVDILLYVIYAQKCPNMLGKRWLVVDCMENVAYVEPRVWRSDHLLLPLHVNI